jgi:hypothetical protein
MCVNMCVYEIVFMGRYTNTKCLECINVHIHTVSKKPVARSLLNTRTPSFSSATTPCAVYGSESGDDDCNDGGDDDDDE